jgi:hypothetical protein
MISLIVRQQGLFLPPMEAVVKHPLAISSVFLVSALSVWAQRKDHSAISYRREQSTAPDEADAASPDRNKELEQAEDTGRR